MNGIRRPILWICVCLAAGCLSLARAGNEFPGYWLRFQYPRGESLTYEIRDTATIRMSLTDPDRAMDYDLTMENEAVQTISASTNAAGEPVLTFRFPEFRFHGTGTLRYGGRDAMDVDIDVSPQTCVARYGDYEAPQPDTFDAMLRVAQEDGLRCQTDDRGLHHALEMDETPFTGTLSEHRRRFRGMTVSLLALPEGEVEVGDSWDVTLPAEHLDLPATAAVHCTLRGIERLDGIDCAVIELTVPWEMDRFDAAKMREMMQLENEDGGPTYELASLEGNTTGTAWFAIGAGRLEKSETEYTYSLCFRATGATEDGPAPEYITEIEGRETTRRRAALK